MSINVSQSFHRTSANAIDDTITLTKAEMLTINDNLMPDHYFTMCQDDGKMYYYDKYALPSLETGKFTVVEDEPEIESISKSDFDQLTQEEKDNGMAYFVPDIHLGNSLIVMGNRFDKANIYTNTERMIGRWIDGKPLYQKTLKLNNPSTVDTWTVTNVGASMETVVSLNTILHSLDNDTWGHINSIKTLGSAISSDTWGDNAILSTASANSNTDNPNCIWLITNYNGWTTNIVEFYAIIQYTKTTDSASINIGTENDYSTDEMIVGTWIDGKPLYQKTVSPNLPTTVVDGTAERVLTSFADLGISNPEFGFVVTGVCVNKTGGAIANVNSAWIGDHYYVLYTAFHVNLGGLYVISNRSNIDSSSCDLYVTVQYTKTTD